MNFTDRELVVAREAVVALCDTTTNPDAAYRISLIDVLCKLSDEQDQRMRLNNQRVLDDIHHIAEARS